MLVIRICKMYTRHCVISAHLCHFSSSLYNAGEELLSAGVYKDNNTQTRIKIIMELLIEANGQQNLKLKRIDESIRITSDIKLRTSFIMLEAWK